MILERPSAAKNSAQWYCKLQIATPAHADVSEAGSFCARSTSLPTKSSDHKVMVAWERYMRAVERSHGVTEVRQQLGLGHGYSAHAMRATLISTVFENAAQLEDVQRMVGHADPSTTQLYDRRRLRIMKSAVLVVAW